VVVASHVPLREEPACEVRFFVDGTGKPCRVLRLSASDTYSWGEALTVQIDALAAEKTDMTAGGDWALPDSKLGVPLIGQAAPCPLAPVVAALAVVRAVGEACMVVGARAMAHREHEQTILAGPAGVERLAHASRESEAG
jgi:hypothetical protein